MRAGLVALCAFLGLIGLLALAVVFAVIGGILQAELSLVVLNGLQFVAASTAIVGIVRNRAHLARVGTSAVGALWTVEMIVDYLTGGSSNSALVTGIIAALTTLLFLAVGAYAARLVARRLAALPNGG
jgi:hypothetical protein